MYASVLKNIVIATNGKEKLYPPDPNGNTVLNIYCDESVKIGMYYHSDTGVFDWNYPEEPEPEPTQLDRIEAAADMKNADIAQSAIDEYTLELIKEGVL